MSVRTRLVLLLRLALAGATMRSLLLIGGYFLGYLAVRRHHVESSLFILAALALVLLCTAGPDEESAAKVHWRWNWLVPLLSLLVSFVLYWPALQIGFLSDDFVLAHQARQNELVASTHEFARPVPLFVWRLILIAGAGARSIHALNVGLHAVNGALTIALARAFGLRRPSALIAGLLFLIWPTQVESVTWASGVFDVMMTTFVLALGVAYVNVPSKRTATRIAGVLILTIAALYTKETAVAIPALLVMLSFTEGAKPSREQLNLFATITAVCISYGIWRVLLRAPATGDRFPMITWYTVKELLSRTFAALAVPFTTEWIRSAPVLAAGFGMAVVLLLISPVVSSRRLLPRARYVVPALSWPVLAAAPAFGYLFIGPDLEGSRYVYLPMAGWVILLVITTQSIVTLRRWLLPIVGFCAIAGAALMVAQTRSLLENWSAAAVHRDALLVQAVGVADVHACQTAHFSGAPKQYNGAQLFRNGLDQAVMAARSNEAGRTQARCEFTWDGRQFRER